MRGTYRTILTLLVSGAVILPLVSHGEEFDHIQQLFDLRTAISDQGKLLPAYIKSASGNNLMTLERIFELNTSALTTVEAYFRIFKIAFTAEEKPSAEAVDVLNEWLAFIEIQCRYDIEYLDEAETEVRDKRVLEEIITAKKNIEKLSMIAEKGIGENEKLLVPAEPS